MNREHSHGSASLNVAVREAIYAEVCDEEFPHGAVPTIAIIDAGCTYDSSATPPRKLRRAILVRPAMVRISHMQRAAGFIDPVDGHKSSQLVDVQRVREVVDHFIGLEHRPNADERLRAHFEKIAEQIAFGQVHRIYNGGFFSSNLTIEAELLDFGNTHILPNWVNAKVLDSDLGFGREMLTLEATIRSLQFHFDKYAGPNAFDANAALLSARSAHSKGFQREICRIAGQGAIDQHSADIEIVEALTEYFNVQQCISHSYTHAGSSAHGWLSLPLGSENTTPTNTQSIAHESKIVGAISRRYKAGTLTKAEARQTYANLNRFLRPRSAIFRDHIQTNVDKLIGDAPTSLVDSISAFVQSTISQGRRHWRHLPDNFVVSAHVYRDGHSLLSGMTGDADKKCLWMEGTVNDGNAVLFDNIFPASSITRLGGSVAGTRWTMIVMNELSEKRTFQLGGLTLTAPDFDVYYD